MERIAVLRSSQKPVWKSCKSIVDNLQETYRLLGKVRFFEIGPTDPFSARTNIFQQLCEFDPDVVVTIDDAEFAPWLLSRLHEFDFDYGRSRFVIHCFGDFYRYAREWKQAEGFLINQRMKFIAASSKARELLKLLIAGHSDLTASLPFPVSDRQFKWSPSRRSRTRKRLGLAGDELFILYSGRLSIQKNPSDLLRGLKFLSENGAFGKTSLTIGLAGPFDSIGLPHFGSRYEDGFYDQYLRNMIAEFNGPGFRAMWLGEYEHDELSDVLNAADAFMSLSLHHNEDFGMALGEALMTGLPAVISDWGGYSWFHEQFEKDVFALDVGRDSSRLPYFQLDPGIADFMLRSKSRSDLAKRARTWLSPRALSERLPDQIANDSFHRLEGFNPLMSELASERNFFSFAEGKAMKDPRLQQLYRGYYSLP